MSTNYYSQNGSGYNSDHSRGDNVNGHHANEHLSVVKKSQPEQAEQRRQLQRQTDCVWLNGELVPFEEATVHVLNPTLHYGLGVFEGIRCYETARGPAIFRLEAHLKRFLQSVRLLGVHDLRYSLVDLRRAAHVTVQANNYTSCYVRPVLYLNGSMELDLDSYEPSVAVTSWNTDTAPSAEMQASGVRMMISSFMPTNPGRVNGQYANMILAKSMAKRAGFDEALLLDADGYVADCTADNLFIVRDGVLYTSKRPSVLEDVTRNTVMTLARDLGYRVVEQDLSRDLLYIADEIFICNTMAEVAPVREIDLHPVGGGQIGLVTQNVAQRYADTVRGRAKRSRGWLEYVMMEPLF